MFGKRKTFDGAADKPTPSDLGEQPAAVTRSSRPDASAVLERQPAPPVAATRRAGEAAFAPRRGPEKAEDGEGKKLTVGPGIKLAGEITACEKLLVEGQVEADLSGAKVLEIAEGGLFKGQATVDRAEVSGTFEGTLTVREHLSLRASGRISGEIRYAEIEVERGGRLSGQIGELDAPVSARPSVKPTPAPQASNSGAAGTAGDPAA